ncbi:tyrosine-type recombinase/integrase [Acidovorax sp. Root217]|uniref:tyrosine-type recombinase/integrase n=1 Tax=Acidovorax sp. Root217 TaxID=1736492 RepID=UPI000AE9E103|nr:tyrosine-type recombinase/integrase [Acidovorax sp. Root217]
MWAYLVALHTSMRSAEILRMSRSTVDLKRRVYHLVRHKTDDDVGDRIVPLTRRVGKLLGVLDAAAAAKDAYFTVTDESRDVNFRKVRDRLIVKGLTFHDSRAAALTWQLSKRSDVMTLAKISGHRNIQELFNTY